MPNPLTYSQALEEARQQQWHHEADLSVTPITCKHCNTVLLDKPHEQEECLHLIVLYALRCTAEEASEEVCVCRHQKSAHHDFCCEECRAESEPCDCQQFRSRKDFLLEEIKKGENTKI